MFIFASSMWDFLILMGVFFTCYGMMLPLSRWSALNKVFMKNIYDYFYFSWVNFFTQNSCRIFLNETKKPKFHNNKYLDMYINTFDGYESSTQSTPLEVVLWYCIKLK